MAVMHQIVMTLLQPGLFGECICHSIWTHEWRKWLSNAQSTSNDFVMQQMDSLYIHHDGAPLQTPKWRIGRGLLNVWLIINSVFFLIYEWTDEVFTSRGLYSPNCMCSRIHFPTLIQNSVLNTTIAMSRMRMCIIVFLFHSRSFLSFPIILSITNGFRTRVRAVWVWLPWHFRFSKHHNSSWRTTQHRHLLYHTTPALVTHENQHEWRVSDYAWLGEATQLMRNMAKRVRCRSTSEV